MLGITAAAEATTVAATLTAVTLGAVTAKFAVTVTTATTRT
jgi:hypothetical protein